MPDKKFTSATGAPIADNTNTLTAGRRGPALLQDVWLIEKLAHFEREVIPERRMHANQFFAGPHASGAALFIRRCTAFLSNVSLPLIAAASLRAAAVCALVSLVSLVDPR